MACCMSDRACMCIMTSCNYHPPRGEAIASPFPYHFPMEPPQLSLPRDSCLALVVLHKLGDSCLALVVLHKLGELHIEPLALDRLSILIERVFEHIVGVEGVDFTEEAVERLLRVGLCDHKELETRARVERLQH